MMRRSTSCFVPNCATGYSSTNKNNKNNGIKNKSIFKCPQNEDLLLQWQRAVPRADKQLSTNDAVCELHFAEEDIIRFYETKLPDGSVNKIRRGKLKLKENAVPCIFPNLPSYLSTTKRKRKAPCTRLPVVEPKAKNFKTEIVEEIVDFTADVILNNKDQEAILATVKEDIDKDFFIILKQEINEVTVPNYYWSGTFISGMNEIVFTEWSKTYTISKRVIIKHDLSVKVIVGNSEIQINNQKTSLTCFEELTCLLKLVDNFILCKGVKVMSAISACTGIAPPRKFSQKSVLAHKCKACQIAYKQATPRLKKPTYLKQKELKGVVKNLNRRNFRLKQKVLQLLRQIEVMKTKCATVTKEAIELAIYDLPFLQQETVVCCSQTTTETKF